MDGAVIVDAKEEGERGACFVALALLRRFVLFLFRRFVVLFLRFVVLFYSSFFRFVYLHFVVFSLSLIRERRGALLLALDEESTAKVIAADSSECFPY